jgi:uncharacterized membrane protein YdbT with pleckstrin-like domain
MYYVQQSLGKNEELIHVGHFHWMYTLGAIMNIIWGVILCLMVLVGSYVIQVQVMGQPDNGFIDAVRQSHVGVRLLAFFMILYGLLGFARMMIIKITTEIAVTSNRLIYKRGLIARYVGEIAIDRIEGVNFLQGMLGRIFNYGSVVVRGMGIGEIILPPIENPVLFKKAIDKAKSG